MLVASSVVLVLYFQGFYWLHCRYIPVETSIYPHLFARRLLRYQILVMSMLDLKDMYALQLV